jgi:hypothetical protein
LGPQPGLTDRKTLRQRRWQLYEAARGRYQAHASRGKSAQVNERVELSGYHRKSVLRLLVLEGLERKLAAGPAHWHRGGAVVGAAIAAAVPA